MSGKRSKFRSVTCPTCGAPGGYACEEHGRKRAPHPKRVEATRVVLAQARKPQRRKTGNNGARLTHTAAPSAEIRAKQAAYRTPKPVTVRYDPALTPWWWTPARRNSVCVECSEPVPAGSALAFRFADQRAVCESCADRLGLAPKPSKAWKRALEKRP